MLTLDDAAQRRLLSAQGHILSPVVTIGKAGLTNNVLEELDRSLLSHELIKIKVHLDNRDTRKTILETICQKLGAAPVQHIGKIFVIYRPNPETTTQKKKNNTQHNRDIRRTKRDHQN